MRSYLVNPLAHFYRLLLNAYPPSYRAQFGREMYDTFIEGIEDAESHGTLGWFLLKELRDTPKALANAYWDGWRTKLQTGIHVLQDIASISDLPPAPPDGRESWRQAFLELSLFTVAALLLITVTYFNGMHAGWQRDPEFLGKVILSLTLPFLLLGLWRGLPRWAYPFGGLLVGYQVFVSYQSSMWLFLFIMLLAFLALAIAEVVTDPQRSLLPLPLRRVGQSLSVDWTRLSFGMFGAVPLVILLAFDDAHVNSRTPYLAISALMMVVCALIYCRSRERSLQISALLAGLTFSICGAWLDKIHFAGGLINWVTVPSAGIEEMFWLLKLWIQWGALIISPVLLTLLGRAVNLKRAV
ncbi:MAG: hypothetical protein HUU11_05475 [Anaerolineales bacterium]|nr:hypothetical protein [Anaerolineales bacterium]